MRARCMPKRELSAIRSVNIRYRYVEGDFHILLFAYAFDDEDVRVVDMACGEELPQEVQDDERIHDEKPDGAWKLQHQHHPRGF